MNKLILIILFFYTFTVAQDNITYNKPNKFDFITNTYDDYKEAYNLSTSNENINTWGWITVSTAILYYFDDDLIKASQKLGENLDIDQGGQNHMKSILSIGPFPIMQIPNSKGSSLYMIGDGTTHISIAFGFWMHGLIADDNKTLSISSQLAEGLVDVGIATQVIKHITGRESPFTATSSRGNFEWFPNQIEYHKHVPAYDAYPSGHLATTMMTVTVLSENYPDNPYIKPIGWVAMTLLSLQMLNNGVHWASDYPLAIGIGYTFGRIVSRRARTTSKKTKKKWYLEPQLTYNQIGVAFEYKY